ncbi:Glyoxalase domain-containing protein 4 [Nymphon striatum]|nr:Glyoxalase domain-containing protein 4 [Nymphon striatum]
MATTRALHFVFKVADRKATAKFYKDILGMKILRHEEMEEGCKATCNGPYSGKWSKTMVGYGPEDSHFVVELTYNYGIGSYELGNDFMGITIESKEAIANAKKNNWPMKTENDCCIVEAPGGYKFYLLDKPQPVDEDPVKKVTLSSSNLKTSLEYWNQLCGMKIYSENIKSAVLGYADNQCKLELKDIGTAVEHGTAFGRIAFSCPASELPVFEKLMKEKNQKILTPLVSLDTPGKATVVVDSHEICYVGDEAFKELSQVDPKSDELLEEGIKADKSDEWFARKKKTKAAA